MTIHQRVHYEWRPLKCAKCLKWGHTEAEAVCKGVAQKQQWSPKEKEVTEQQATADQVPAVSNPVMVENPNTPVEHDADGFRIITHKRGSQKVVDGHPTPVILSNAFAQLGRMEGLVRPWWWGYNFPGSWINILTWNVKGLNGPRKQKEVRNFLQRNKIGMCCLVETKIKKENFAMVHHNLFQNWCIATNFAFSAVKGNRWLVFSSAYSILRIHPECGLNFEFYCTFVYGMNDAIDRDCLWDELQKLGDNCTMPWLLSGDFKCPLNFEDRIGKPVSQGEVERFRECVYHCGLK